MKKIICLLITFIVIQVSVFSQDFVLNNPVMTPNPAVFPGMVQNITFDFYVSHSSSYTFSSNDLSNNYATITFSFTKLNPASVTPSGTGANLFTWVLNNNGGSGTGLVYTWTGRSKTIEMLNVPTNPKYKITFSNVPITYGATPAESDVRVAGQFTDPGNAPTGNSGNNSAVIATYTTAGGPLPISLFSFNANKNTSTVSLNWKTSSEVNSNRFEVETSTDGTSWKTIGNVAAAGVSISERNYDFIHHNPLNGVNYYRLKQIDNGESFKYSQTRTVTFTGTTDIKVMPNPTTDRLIITANRNVRFESVTVFNLDGKLMETNQKFQSGNSIDMRSYPTGIYMIKIIDDAGKTDIKTVIKN